MAPKPCDNHRHSPKFLELRRSEMADYGFGEIRPTVLRDI